MKLHLGDCLEVLKSIPDSSIDSCVTDPPYGLEFMGKDWDAPWKSDARQQFDGTLPDSNANPYRRSEVRNGNGQSHGADSRHMQAFQKYMTPIFAEILRVLKPGGHLLSFGGSRTYHRMACAVEDAGFEVRDQIMWIYGSGFPKSLDVSKAIDKAAGAKREKGPVDESRAARLVNQQGEYETDAGWSAGSRSVTVDPPATDLAKQWSGWGTALKPAHEPIVMARKPLIGTVAKNVCEHGTGGLNIDGCRVDGVKDVPASPRRADQGSAYGDLSNASGDTGGFNPNVGRWPANLIHDGSDEVIQCFPDAPGQIADSVEDGEDQGNAIYGKMKRGGPNHKPRDEKDKCAARFFYCPKAARSERGKENNHPTVKPIALMQYLCRLVTPPNGVILDPFLGSGTTGIAALAEGFDFIGIEKNEDYLSIAEKRINERQ